MKILALDTSSQACSVAIANGQKIYHAHHIAPKQHTQLILRLIQNLLAESALSLAELDFITYGCGPGSFTGVRIANSVAQGLGFAHSKPLVPVSSLMALAQTLFMREKCEAISVAIDARMGQLYWASYRASEHAILECTDHEKLIEPTHATISKPTMTEVGVGDGWGKYTDILSAALHFRPSKIYPDELVSATSLIPIAERYFKQGKAVTPDQAVPVYLR